ncbi:MAG: F0F1 ATP synthase subunit delta [Gammaproteobacteria bacterium]
MAELTTLARPYAKAAFEFANENGALDAWSSALGFLAQVVDNDSVQTMIGNPATSDGELLKMFEAVAGDQLNEHSTNFLRLLMENNRLEVLPDIAALFEVMKSEAEGAVDVEVTSVEPVSEDYKTQLGDALRKKLGRDVRLNFSLDETLIGGALVRAGDLVIDGTVRGRLNQLTGALAD